MPTDNELRQTYPDVLGDVDTNLLCLVRDLHAIGQVSRDLAPRDASLALENEVPHHVSRPRRPVPSNFPRMSRLHTVATLAAVLVLVALLATGAALAINNIANLGKPNNAVPLYLPIGSFRHAGQVLRQHGKPELLFIDTSVDGGSAAESWPVVKALSQFGRWSGLRASTSRACMLVQASSVQINCKVPGGYVDVRSVPEFDFSQARYASRYVNFADKDLIDRALHFHPGLSKQQLTLFNHYARPPGYPVFRDAVLEAALNAPGAAPGKGLPLLAVGGYVEAGANVVTQGDLESYSTLGLPFSTIQRSLQRGRSVGGASSTLVSDVNAEANIITALICHADHMQPKHVCGRAVIRKIVRHVR